MSTLGTDVDTTGADRPIPTGFRDLDLLLAGGVRPGEMIVASGYPGLGASMFALGLARKAAIANGLRTFYATLESTTPQTARRVLSAESRVSLLHLTAGQPREGDRERIARANARISDAALLITDRSRSLDAISLDMVAGGKPRMLVVDGAHLMIPSHDYGGRAQFADDFARDLKELAVTLGIVVIATLPLEFPFAERPGNYPLLRDFGKRQSFAAAADIVILIHREDHYERESPRAGEADLIIAKSRNSPLATITVAFQAHYARFVDMAMS